MIVLKDNCYSIEYAGVIYSSRKELALAYNLDVGTLRKRLRDGIMLDTPKGQGKTGRPRKINGRI